MPQSTVNSSSHSDELLEHLQSSLQNLKSSTATIGGKQYHVASPSDLSSLERRINRALAHCGESAISPTALIDLNDKVARLIMDNDQLNKAVAMGEATLAETKKTLVASRSAWSTKNKELEELKKANLAESARLREELKEANVDRRKLVAELGQPAAKFDPEAALLLEDALAEAKAQVAGLNEQLKQVNNTNKAAQAEVNKLAAETKRTEEALAAESARVAEFKNLIHAASTGQRSLEISPAMRQLLGPAACDKLSALSTVGFDDVKERAYLGMTALSKHKNKLLKAIGKLFEVVWQWAKTQSLKVRKGLLPWVNMVFEDLFKAALKPVAFYRDELVKLKVIIEEKKKALVSAGIRAAEQEDGFFSDMWFYGYAIVLRIRRRSTPFVVRAWRTVKGCGFAFAQGLRNLGTIFAHGWQAAKDGKSHEQSQAELKVKSDQFLPKIKAAYWSAFGHEPVTTSDVAEVLYESKESLHVK